MLHCEFITWKSLERKANIHSSDKIDFETKCTSGGRSEKRVRFHRHSSRVARSIRNELAETYSSISRAAAEKQKLRMLTYCNVHNMHHTARNKNWYCTQQELVNTEENNFTEESNFNE